MIALGCKALGGSCRCVRVTIEVLNVEGVQGSPDV